MKNLRFDELRITRESVVYFNDIVVSHPHIMAAEESAISQSGELISRSYDFFPEFIKVWLISV